MNYIDDGNIIAEVPETEQEEVLRIFAAMLAGPTGDGKVKREAGTKPSWKVDTSHEAGIFSHLSKWKHGERIDADSGYHPLVHLAWRALAIAWQQAQKPPSVVPNEESALMEWYSEGGR